MAVLSKKFFEFEANTNSLDILELKKTVQERGPKADKNQELTRSNLQFTCLRAFRS